MKRAVQELLAAENIHPVLLDIGASGEPHPIWQPIAGQSIYVGFDPDDREVDPARYTGFQSSRIVPKAVLVSTLRHAQETPGSTDAGSSDAESGQVTFYLTASPFCSSTLRPDSAGLAPYLFADLFAVEREASAPAISLAAALAELGLERVDWFKADSQGTDLRLFRSLPPAVRDGVLALDVEPGLFDAYEGEDLWIDAHRALTGDGFWLSHLDVRGAVRLHRENLTALARYAPGTGEAQAARAVRPSPGWGESRYLRTVEWLLETGADERAFLLLWAFAGLDGQLGFALDVGAAYARRFGEGETAHLLQREAAQAIRRAYPVERILHFAGRIFNRVQRSLRDRRE